MRWALAEGRWFLRFAASVLADAAVPAETPCPRVPGLVRQPAERPCPCRDLQPCSVPATGNQVRTLAVTPEVCRLHGLACETSCVFVETHTWETAPDSISRLCLKFCACMLVKFPHPAFWMFFISMSVTWTSTNLLLFPSPAVSPVLSRTLGSLKSWWPVNGAAARQLQVKSAFCVEVQKPY